MNKTIAAIAFGIITATAATAALAQAPGWGSGPCYRQGAPVGAQPGTGYGPGRMMGMRGDPAQRMTRRLDFLTTRLGLSTEQQTRIKSILEEQRATRSAMRGQTHERIAAVLTSDQRAKFDQMRASFQGGRPGGRGMGYGPGAGAGQ